MPGLFGKLHRLWTLTRHLPIALAYPGAAEDVRAERYGAAEKKLLRAYRRMPPGDYAPAPVHLLMSMVQLRLGNPTAAAEFALSAERRARAIVRFVNPMDRAYMLFMAKQLYEQATRSAGNPLTIDVGVRYEDLDMQQVMDVLQETFGLPSHKGRARRQLH